MQQIPSDVLIPRGSELHGIEDKYGPLKDEIKCGLEGCRTLHGHGFVVSFSNQSRGIVHSRGVVGHVCGKNAFGTEWTKAESVYDAQVRETEVQAASERFRARMGAILPELETALPRLAWQHKVRGALTRHAPRLMQKCYEAASKRGGHIEDIRGQEFVSVHQLRGILFWLDDRALDRAKELEYSAAQLKTFMNTPEATPKEIDNRLSRLGDVVHTWSLVCRWMNAADEAISPQHLKQVIGVINRIPDPALLAYGLTAATAGSLGIRVTRNVLEVSVLIDARNDESEWRVAARLDEPSEVGVTSVRR